jgi:hypothetical protein
MGAGAGAWCSKSKESRYEDLAERKKRLKSKYLRKEVHHQKLKIQINLYSNAKDSSTEITVENKSVSDKYRVGEILRRIHLP